MVKAPRLSEPTETTDSTAALLANRALDGRPSFSIRLRITSAFLLAMVFSISIGIASMVIVSRMDSKQSFFEQAENFAAEIQDARRYEKNYFLYGSKSDLYDALGHIRGAGAILEKTADIRSVLRADAYATLADDLKGYEQLLSQLAAQDFGGGRSANPRDPDMEAELRRFGHQILSYAAGMVKQERINMHATAGYLRLVAIFALVINLIVIVWVATELTRQILRPLGRAVEYTRRIAQSDFSLITPTRKYRDEFSDLTAAINRMILELREHQEQLLQSRKMAAVGTLTSGIAHELNNPLNNIGITTEALLEAEDEYSSEQVKNMLREIATQTERASTTVRNLLDFTRADRCPPESIDIKELVRASLRLVSSELTLHHIETQLKMPADLPRTGGQFRSLQQVFVNLCLNAIQAMGDGGRLTIRGRVEDEEFVRVEISDTGCGISQDHLDRIFDPFFTTKPVGQGTGLGLSVSYGIVQEMGGRIEVESEEGNGSTFALLLRIGHDVP